MIKNLCYWIWLESIEAFKFFEILNFIIFFIVTSNFKILSYPRSFLCEKAKIQRKKLCEIGEEAIWESHFPWFFKKNFTYGVCKKRKYCFLLVLSSKTYKTWTFVKRIEFFFHSCDYNTFSYYILRMWWESKNETEDASKRLSSSCMGALNY